jgi:hypothetical protein
MHREATADARAQNHGEYRRRARCGAVGRLRQSEAVGVVGHCDRPLQHLREVAVQRLAIEPGRVGVLEQAGRRGNRAGRAKPHGAACAELLLGLRDQRADRRQGRIIAAARARPPAPQQGRAAFVKPDDLDLAAAEIDAQGDGHADSINRAPASARGPGCRARDRQARPSGARQARPA